VVGIAQAIVHNPDVVILDEPTVGLDPNQIKDVRQADQGARRRAHDHPLDTHPARGRDDLRPGGDH
jgi:energy-coupling factor transporter ATP-binding protein EcfA2